MKFVFEASSLGFSYGASSVLDSLNFSILPGEVVGILGPNGAGKTTLLRILGRLQGGWNGSLSFRGRPIQSWTRRDLSREVAYVPQRTEVSFPYTARQVVMMGRNPYSYGHFLDSTEDRQIVESALQQTRASSLADKPYSDLSGGEQQLVVLASALAQQAGTLLLDEPTVFLDVRHQLMIYRILERLHESQGTTLVLATHDLNLAESFCSRLILLKDGRIQDEVRPADGPLNSSQLESLFDLQARDTRQGPQNRIQLSFGK